MSPTKQSENSQADMYNMSSTLGFNISTIQVFTYLEYLLAPKN